MISSGCNDSNAAQNRTVSPRSPSMIADASAKITRLPQFFGVKSRIERIAALGDGQRGFPDALKLAFPAVFFRVVVFVLADIPLILADILPQDRFRGLPRRFCADQPAHLRRQVSINCNFFRHGRIIAPLRYNSLFPQNSPNAQMHPPPVIAIDGPAASGKGRVSVLLAQKLGFHCLDSGAIYRAVALRAIRENAQNSESISKIAQHLSKNPQSLAKLLNDPELSAPETGERASQIAALPELRQKLLPLQRAKRIPPGLVADGRDMAAIVFPDAILKVFLTAKPDIRARRRLLQLQEKGISATIDSVRAELRARDQRDAERKHAALTLDPDAIVVESDSKSPEEIVRELEEKFRAAHFCPQHRAKTGA